MHITTDTHALPPTTYRTIAVLTAALGLACAALNAWLFVLGMQRFGADAAAPLISTGLLMVVTEHVAFGLASLLPRSRFAALRRLLMTLGVLLLAFECVSMYTAQAAMAQAAGTAATAHATRVQTLQAAVTSGRAAIDALRTSSERQGASSNSWTRHLGAQGLRAAMAAEADLAIQAAELASLQATTAPTVAQALGDQGVVASNVLRTLLIGGMGLMMFSAAGALWAAAANPLPTTAAPAMQATPSSRRAAAELPRRLRIATASVSTTTSAEAETETTRPRAPERQQAVSADHHLVQEFWEAFDYLDSLGTSTADGLDPRPVLNHSRDAELIAVNLNEFVERATHHRRQIPMLADLKKVLRTSKARRFVDIKTVNSAINAQKRKEGGEDIAKTVHCWVFERPSTAHRHQQAIQPGLFDHKRAAAGERDDD